MPYWQLFYHVVWATKNREPLLTARLEPVVHGFLRAKAVGLGAMVFALNGVEDHVHMVASIPPGIPVARFVGQVKAVASAKLNKSGLSVGRFSWQKVKVGAFGWVVLTEASQIHLPVCTRPGINAGSGWH